MPWHIEPRGTRFCVVKTADDTVVHCHESRPQAITHLRALYASDDADALTAALADVAFAVDDDGSLVEPLEPVDVVALAREVDVNLPGGPGHQLRNYWVRGPGAIKIGWGTDGSFARCVAELGKYVRDPQGLCAEYHHAATGEWPAEKGVPSAGETLTAHAVPGTADGGCPPEHHLMPDGTCMPDAEMPGVEAAAPPTGAYAGDGTAPWDGILTLEGDESGDGRMFAPDSLEWDDPPLALMWQKETSHGGKTDVTVEVGRIDEVWREPDPDRPGVNLIRARGVIDLGNPDGAEVHRRMGGNFLAGGGNSVDVDSVGPNDVELVYPSVSCDPVESLIEMVYPDLTAPPRRKPQPGQPTGAPLERPELTIYHRGRIRASTLVAIPAFTGARLQLTQPTSPEPEPEENPVADAEPVDVTAASDGTWDAGAEEAHLPSPVPLGDARKMFAYVDARRAEDGTVPKDAGKLPHHHVNPDGSIGEANLTGVSAAIGALHGARTPVKMSPEAKKAAYAHLAAHLRVAGKEAPPFSANTDAAGADLTAATHTLTITDVPPAEWFEEPTDVSPTGALTVTDEGRVYGYLAPAGVRHRSFSDRRQYVPLGNVDYSRFHGGETVVAGGGRVVTGPITMNCGHATTSYSLSGDEARDHYDNTCSMVASVRVGENKNGVWIAGALLPGVTPDQVTRMMASRLSGDWRAHLDRPGWREFVAALLVPVPGFPMARVTASVQADRGQLVASSVPVRFVHDYDEDDLVSSADERVRELEAQVAAYRSRDVETLRRRVGVDNSSLVAALRERVALHGTHNQKSHGNDGVDDVPTKFPSHAGGGVGGKLDENVPAGRAELLAHIERRKGEIAAKMPAHKARVADIIKSSKDLRPKRGSEVVVDIDGEERIIKVSSVRNGKVAGPTVDGLDDLYIDDPVLPVSHKGESSGSAGFKVPASPAVTNAVTLQRARVMYGTRRPGETDQAWAKRVKTSVASIRKYAEATEKKRGT